MYLLNVNTYKPNGKKSGTFRIPCCIVSYTRIGIKIWKPLWSLQYSCLPVIPSHGTSVRVDHPGPTSCTLKSIDFEVPGTKEVYLCPPNFLDDTKDPSNLLHFNFHVRLTDRGSTVYYLQGREKKAGD